MRGKRHSPKPSANRPAPDDERAPQSAERPNQRAYTDALRMLARRELSEAQVRQRLVRREHEADAIDAAVARLRDERAIDDARTAAAIARTETGIKRRGRLRVKQQLAKAGISASTARAATDEVFGDLDEDALLEAALDRRLRHGRTIADDREFSRLYRYLITQGFEADRAINALKGRRERK